MTFDYGTAAFTIVWVFGWAIFVLLVWFIRGQRRERMIDRIHKERMMALEKGLPLPELPEYDRASAAPAWSGIKLNPRWPLGVGAIFITVGLGGFLAMAASTKSLLPGEQYHNEPWGWLVVVAFGIGLWLHYFLTRR